MMERQCERERDRNKWLHRYNDREHSNGFVWNEYEQKRKENEMCGNKK